MAKQNQSTKNSTDIWEEIDSTNINVIGKRVFYNHPDLGKCDAKVTGIIQERNELGQIQNWLRVWPNNGSEPFNIRAALDDSRTIGTYSLAKSGDLVN